MSRDQKRISVFALTGVAFMTLSLAACQPAEGPMERAGKQIDQSVEQVGQELKKAGDKVDEAVKDVKN